MEETFEFTEKQLIEAMRIYNSEFLANPESFYTLEEIDDSEDCAKLQAQKILSILKTLA